MSRRQHVLVFGVTSVAVVVALYLAAFRKHSDAAGLPSMEPAVSTDATIEQGGEDDDGGARRVVEPVSTRNRLHFVDARGHAIADVMVFEHDQSLSYVPTSRQPLALSNADGIADVTLHAGRPLACFKQGYLCASIGMPGTGLKRVEMMASERLEVVCTDEFGNKAAGCQVVLSKRKRLRPPSLDGVAVGLASAKSTLWSAVTDDAGTAVLEGFPQAKYRVYIFSGEWCAVDPMFQGEAAIMLSSQTLNVTVVPIVGVAFGRPAGAEENIESLWYQWRKSGKRNHVNLRVKGYAAAALRRRHPSALFTITEVGSRGSGGDFGTVRIETQLSDGRLCVAEAKMLPIRDAPLSALELREIVPMRDIKLVVAGVGPTNSSNLKLAMKVGRNRIPVTVGSVKSIPCGVYKLSTPLYEAPGADKWLPKRVTVAEGDHVQEIKVSLGHKYRMVRVRTRFEFADLNEPVFLGLEHDSGAFVGFAPREGGDSAYDILLPYGSVTFSAAALDRDKVRRRVGIARDTPSEIAITIPF